MATNAQRGTLTMLGLARQIGPDNNILDIAEVLDELNPIFIDAPMLRANDITSHLLSRRTSVPTPSWRKINEGIAVSRGSVQQVRENIGMLEARSEIDVAVLDISPEPGKLRTNEDHAQLEGMAQEFANTFIGGSMDSSPEEFDGLEKRYGTIDGLNVFNNGETVGSTNTSIWMVQWGSRMAHLIFPRNSSTIGITREDLGQETITDTSTPPKKFNAWVTKFMLNIGLAIHDTRSVKRIANINSDFSDAQSLNENLIIQAINEFPTNANGVVMYVNRDVQTQLDILAKDKNNVNYLPNGPFGGPQMFFRGIPVHRMDAITSTESVIS